MECGQQIMELIDGCRNLQIQLLHPVFSNRQTAINGGIGPDAIEDTDIADVRVDGFGIDIIVVYNGEESRKVVLIIGQIVNNLLFNSLIQAVGVIGGEPIPNVRIVARGEQQAQVGGRLIHGDAGNLHMDACARLHFRIHQVVCHAVGHIVEQRWNEVAPQREGYGILCQRQLMGIFNFQSGNRRDLLRNGKVLFGSRFFFGGRFGGGSFFRGCSF